MFSTTYQPQTNDSRLYDVSLYCYEDRLKDKYDVFFRNRPKKLEVVEGNRTLLTVKDDDLGTVGCGVVTLLAEREKNTLPLTYLVATSGKYRAPLAKMSEAIDIEGFKRVI